jgi:hypothetical protein
MLRRFVVCPAGAEQISPGQRSGKRNFREKHMIMALKGRNKRPAMVRTFRALLRGSSRSLGRCPALICRCPFGAIENCATTKSASEVRRASVREPMHFPRWSFGLVFRSARRMGLRVRKRTRRHVGRERGDSAEVERLWQAVVTEARRPRGTGESGAPAIDTGDRNETESRADEHRGQEDDPGR